MKDLKDIKQKLELMEETIAALGICIKVQTQAVSKLMSIYDEIFDVVERVNNHNSDY